MSYASGTVVSVEKSKAELDRLLSKHGATQRMFGEDERSGFAICVFALADRQVRLRIPIPTPDEIAKKTAKPRNWWSLGDAGRQNWMRGRRDQVGRERWRQLLLIVKAKLEIIGLGLSTVEREFLADLFLPDGRTVHEAIQDSIAQSYIDGKMPRLLQAAPPPPVDVMDAEVEE